MVNYVNRLLDQVNIGKIIHSPQSFQVFPASKEYLLYTGVTFKYSNNIRLRVTNYKETVTTTKGYVPCACNHYQEYIDENYEHVVTGNLNIIGNEEIRKLLIKGLNFWEKQPLDVGKAYGSIQSDIDMFINLSSNTAKIPIKLFSPSY